MFDSESYVAQPKDVPDDAYWRALESCSELRIQNLKAAKAYYDEIEHLRKEYLDKLHGIIGKENLEKYLTLHTKRMKAMISAKEECPPTAEGQRRFEEIRRRTVEKSTEVINRSSVDTSNVRPLQETYRDKAFRVSSKTVDRGKIPERISTIQNEEFYPPYSGWAWEYSWYRSGGLNNPRLERYLDHNTGESGSDSHIHVGGADDSDSARVTYRTAIRQWYRMRDTGRVGVIAWIQGLTRRAPFSGSVYDECGWSAVHVYQHMRIYFQVIAPVSSPRFYWNPEPIWGYLPLTIDDTNESSHKWSSPTYPSLFPYGHIIPDVGSDRPRYIIIPQTFDRDTWILVDVGIETQNYFWSNDCTVGASLHQKLKVHKIGIGAET